MENLPNLAISCDAANGLALTISDSGIFDYIEEFLIDNAPAIYAAIEDIEMGPDFGHTVIYFADSLAQSDLEKTLAGLDRSRLEI